MRPRIAVESPPRSLTLVLLFLIFAPACTFYGEHPARSFSEATGGESLESVAREDGRRFVERAME